MSTIKVGTVEKASGDPVDLTKQKGVTHWISFNGTGTISVRGSFNNSSVTDHGTGEYSFDFTNSLTNGNNYCANVSVGGDNDGDNRGITVDNAREAPSASGYAVDVVIATTAGSADEEYVYASTIGDLA